MRSARLFMCTAPSLALAAGLPDVAGEEDPDLFFRATISPVSTRYHGQWNVALTELPEGRVLAIWEAGHTELETENVILSATSSDGGRTWSTPEVFYQRAGVRCTPCGFFEAQGVLHGLHGELPLAGGHEPCRVIDRVSSDGGRSWGEPREVWQTEWGVAMQPVVLRDGRVALPVYYGAHLPGGEATSAARVLISADAGQTWQEGPEIRADLPGGAMEPALAESDRGEWVCLLRTRGTGWIYAARSTDGGRSWTPPAPLPLESPESIARLLGLHDGSLLVVWNGVASESMAPRNPLTAARSTDGGRTWPQRRDLVRGEGPALYSNHGVVQLRDGRVLVGYQDFHRDPERAPQRSGVDSVELVGFDLHWLEAILPAR